MRRIATFVLLIALAATLSTNTVAAGSRSRVPKLAVIDWSATAANNLAAKPPQKKDVERFVAAVENAVTGDSILGVEGGTYICSFRFADLHHAGVLSLAVGIGVVDRPSCGEIEVIDRTPSGFELYKSGGSIGAGADMPSNIRDLGNDGRLQILVYSGLSILTDRCTADWIGIFAWANSNYANVSDRYKNFYRQELDSIQKALPTLQSTPGSNGYSLDSKECLEAEAAAIQRFLGISSGAGIDQAVRLATSSESADRDFATQLLGEIGTPRARTYLEKLANDPDNVVASAAKYALSRSANGPMKVVESTFQHAGSARF